MSLEGGREKGTGYFFTHKLCPNLDRYDKAEPLTANEMELLLESGNPTALREGINRFTRCFVQLSVISIIGKKGDRQLFLSWSLLQIRQDCPEKK